MLTKLILLECKLLPADWNFFYSKVLLYFLWNVSANEYMHHSVSFSFCTFLIHQTSHFVTTSEMIFSNIHPRYYRLFTVLLSFSRRILLPIVFESQDWFMYWIKTWDTVNKLCWNDNLQTSWLILGLFLNWTKNPR